MSVFVLCVCLMVLVGLGRSTELCKYWYTRVACTRML